MLHQNAPHHLGRDREKVSAILPLHALIIHQPRVGFIHQRRGLQAMTGALRAHIAARQAAKLLIHDGSQFFERAPVSFTPGAEQRADVVHGRFTWLFTGLCRFAHRVGELYRR